VQNRLIGSFKLPAVLLTFAVTTLSESTLGRRLATTHRPDSKLAAYWG
jgi:hypothetical protein